MKTSFTCCTSAADTMQESKYAFQVGIVCLLGYYLGNYRHCYNIKNSNWFCLKSHTGIICLIKKKKEKGLNPFILLLQMIKWPNSSGTLAFVNANWSFFLYPRLLYRRAFPSTKMPQKAIWMFTLTKTTSCQRKCKENRSLLYRALTYATFQVTAPTRTASENYVWNILTVCLLVF